MTVINPLRRGSGTTNHRRGSANIPEKSIEPDIKFSARASRRLSKRELVLEENLSNNTGTTSSHTAIEVGVINAWVGSLIRRAFQTVPDAEHKELLFQMKEMHQQNDKLKYQVDLFVIQFWSALHHDFTVDDDE